MSYSGLSVVRGVLGYARRHILRLVLLLLSATLAGALAAYYLGLTTFSPYYHWRAAHEALGRHDFRAALEHLNECLEDWPRDATTHFLTARTCRRAGMNEAAATHLAAAASLGYPREQIQLESELTLAQSGRVDAVQDSLLDRLEKLPKKDRTRFVIYEALLLGCHVVMDVKRGERFATQWIAEDPNSWQPYYLRGALEEQANREDAAVTDFEKALTLRPDLTGVRLVLARYQLARGRFQESRELYQAILDKRPGDLEALVGLAANMRGMGEFDQASSVVDRALRAGDESVDALLLRGQLDLQRGDAGAALPYLRKAEQRAPQKREVLQALAQALRGLESSEASEYDRRLQELAQGRGRLTHAVAELKQLQQGSSHDTAREVKMCHEIALLHHDLGEDREAWLWVQSALRLDPRHTPSLTLRAKLPDPTSR